VPFPPDLLHAKERIVIDSRPHWWFVTPAAAALAGMCLLGIVAVSAGWPSWLGVFIGVVLLVALGYFAVRYAKWISTNFVLTNDRVIYRFGVIAKKGVEIPLDKVNTVFFNQTIFGRIMGFGSLRIESASETGSDMFTDIRKPSLVQNEIYIQMDAKSDEHYDRIGEAARDGVLQGQQAAGGGGGLSIPEQISQLDELRTKGLLSEDEFQAKKAELLDRM
jgi:uncharacterized membrane protein YdbT with pleckstrin-like domain